MIDNRYQAFTHTHDHSRIKMSLKKVMYMDKYVGTSREK